MSATHTYAPGTGRIRQPWLGVLRAAWVLVTLAALAIYALSVPGYVQVYYTDPIQIAGLSPGVARSVSVVLGGASLLVSLLALALGGLLYWRRSDHTMPLLLSFVLMLYGVLLAGPSERLEYLLPGSQLVARQVLSPMWSWLLVLFFALFPDGRFVPRWSKWLVLLAVWSAALEAARFLLPLPAAWSVAQTVGYVVLMTLMLGVQIYRYRAVSTPAERQQTKWVVYGLCLWMLFTAMQAIPYQMVLSLPEDAPQPLWATLVGASWVISLAILPVTLTIALLRYRLFDIDRLIRRTLVYSGVTALLAGIYFGTVVLAQSALVALTGQESPLAVVVSTLAVAALFNPIRARLQRLVDRAFYRKSYDAEQTLARFGEAVQSEMDVDGVEAALLRAVNDTLQPASAGLWVPEVER